MASGVVVKYTEYTKYTHSKLLISTVYPLYTHRKYDSIPTVYPLLFSTTPLRMAIFLVGDEKLVGWREVGN